MAEKSGLPENVSTLLASSVGIVINSDAIILESDLTVDEAIRRMMEKNQRSVLASHKGEVVGMVSKTDILYKVTSEGRNPSKVRLREIMTSPVLAVAPQTTIRETLGIMNKRNVRQVMVHAFSAVLGIVSREDIYKMMETISLASEDSALHGTPMCIIDQKTISYNKDTTRAKFSCPYCGSPFDDSEVLSKHIDRLHIGAGALEGDVRQMF
ncbi:cyclic nucleotide-binding/CBS domain-containing protein [Nitrososphaera sp.]|uniref:CBS domain-containing protein n=1 Tax=Nitrososphaera sp. TaxID=1971748 RepID=UPI002EDA2942